MGAKNEDKVKTVHHKLMKSQGGDNSPRNISIVPLNKHRAFHLLFGNKRPHEIADVLNNIWLDPAYKFITVRRKG